MLDKRIQIWNILHDGEITAISESDATLTMFVSIPYLRRRLSPLGDSFVLTLSGLNYFEFIDFNGTKTSLKSELDIGTPEILSTDSEAMPIKIETTMGRLGLNFQIISFALDTGQAIEFEAIRKASEAYWEEWEGKRGGPIDHTQ